MCNVGACPSSRINQNLEVQHRSDTSPPRPFLSHSRIHCIDAFNVMTREFIRPVFGSGADGDVISRRIDSCRTASHSLLANAFRLLVLCSRQLPPYLKIRAQAVSLVAHTKVHKHTVFSFHYVLLSFQKALMNSNIKNQTDQRADCEMVHKFS